MYSFCWLRTWLTFAGLHMTYFCVDISVYENTDKYVLSKQWLWESVEKECFFKNHKDILISQKKSTIVNLHHFSYVSHLIVRLAMIFTVMRQISLSCSISCLVNVTVQINLVVVVVFTEFCKRKTLVGIQTPFPVITTDCECSEDLYFYLDFCRPSLVNRITRADIK